MPNLKSFILSYPEHFPKAIEDLSPCTHCVCINQTLSPIIEKHIQACEADGSITTNLSIASSQMSGEI